MTDDAVSQFKALQRESWGSFGPLVGFTTMAAASLVEYAQLRAGQSMLDVGCGTGIVALTARRCGAQVCGIDLSPALLEQARRNAALIDAQIHFSEADVEKLPFADGHFDVVVSQFGHMFAPRPRLATGQMLRVLKSGGRICFSTWPPSLLMGRLFSLTEEYLPRSADIGSPVDWGDQRIVREHLGDAVRDVEFNYDDTVVPALSPAHLRASVEVSVAPVAQVLEHLGDDSQRLGAFRARLDTLIGEYFSRNRVRQTFLMTRAVKR